MINVTKTHLPDINKYKHYVDKIFESGWLTNNGQFVQELTERLSRYLGVKNLLLVSNGTLALQVAYKALGLKGDVVTTPFSFVATTSTLLWEGLNPVFVDIDPDSLTLDPDRVEAAITARTCAIVATHVYGNPCSVEKLAGIARKYKLSLIYDAAHAFGVNYKTNSILEYGDVSTISFHSTKLFHTIEGGAIAFKDDSMYEVAREMINFGIVSPTEITRIGINAKMNEFQAAMGLCVLDEMDGILNRRKKAYMKYKNQLANCDGIRFPVWNLNASNNYSYFPVIFEEEKMMQQVMEELNRNNIFPRRYFTPSLNKLPFIQESNSMAISEDISSRVVCLPLSDYLEEKDQDEIINIIWNFLM